MQEARPLFRTKSDTTLAPLFPFVVVIPNKNLIIQAIDLRLDRSQVVGEDEHGLHYPVVQKSQTCRRRIRWRERFVFRNRESPMRFPNASHWAQVDVADDVNASMLDFLDLV